MKRQRNTQQVKEHDKCPPNQTKEEEIGSLSGKEFQIMTVKMRQSIVNNAITEIKSTLEGTNSRITEAEDRISEVEDRMVEINEAERKKELKEMMTTSETSGTMSNAPTFES